MKKFASSNTKSRLISSAIMLAGLALIIILSKYVPKLHIVRWVGVAIMVGAIYETLKNFKTAKKEVFDKNKFYFVGFIIWLILDVVSVYFVGAQKMIMLWLLLIIVGANVGAWFFGKMIGGDKLWERISKNKTWAGQIGGIICGTLMSVLFTLYFQPFGGYFLFSVLLGCTISLLSQYGDLTASFLKRCLGIKDSGNLLPGHGGILDRFDGWIYVLPFHVVIYKLRG